jgi:hypothetical protein
MAGTARYEDEALYKAGVGTNRRRVLGPAGEEEPKPEAVPEDILGWIFFRGAKEEVEPFLLGGKPWLKVYNHIGRPHAATNKYQAKMAVWVTNELTRVPLPV